MDKLLKYLMFVFMAVVVASCGGDDKNEPDNPTNDKVHTTTFPANTKCPIVTINNVNNSGYDGYVYISVKNNVITISGSLIDDCYVVDCGEIPTLSSVTLLPPNGWSKSTAMYENHVYAATYSYQGVAYYVRFTISENRNAHGNIVGYQISYQSFNPAN